VANGRADVPVPGPMDPEQRERACVAGGLDLAGGCALPIRRAAPVRPSRGAGSLTGIAVRVPSAVFSILESVAFDTGYAGSNGLEPQSWVNGNGTSYCHTYIYSGPEPNYTRISCKSNNFIYGTSDHFFWILIYLHV